MTIFDLTIGRILGLVESITKALFGPPIEILKTLGLTFSLIITGLLLYFWIKLEMNDKDEITFWQVIIKNRKEYKFLKRAKEEFLKIKANFYKNKIQSLIEINNFLDEILTIFGYKGSLEEKLDKIYEKFLPNKEEIKKARKILILIDQRINQGKNVNLSESDYLTIFHEYEKGLFYLNVITEEDFLVKNQEQQK
jgi:hypothetical protein